MGFKTNKNKTSGVSQQGNSVFAKKLRSKVEQFSKLFGDSEKSKSYLQLAVISLLVSVLILLYLFVNIPRNNSLTQSLGELRLLSQTMSRQATDVMGSGNKESILALKASQNKFAENFETVKRIHSENEDLAKVETIWNKVSSDVSLVTSQQKLINQLFDANVEFTEIIPQIQSDYNLLVNDMASADMPSTQVVMAKNQVFIAERILRSIGSVLSSTINTRENSGDFKQDIETFGIYLDAQVNGSAELGITQLTQPDMRESLERIKADYDGIVKSDSTG